MSKTKYWVTFSIVEAENLPAGDANGLSDPYVTVDLSPGNKRILKTSVKPETLNPKWVCVCNRIEACIFVSFKKVAYAHFYYKTVHPPF